MEKGVIPSAIRQIAVALLYRVLLWSIAVPWDEGVLIKDAYASGEYSAFNGGDRFRCCDEGSPNGYRGERWVLGDAAMLRAGKDVAGDSGCGITDVSSISYRPVDR
jgi:hypothetical protein